MQMSIRVIVFWGRLRPLLWKASSCFVFLDTPAFTWYIHRMVYPAVNNAFLGQESEGEPERTLLEGGGWGTERGHGHSQGAGRGFKEAGSLQGPLCFPSAELLQMQPGFYAKGWLAESRQSCRRSWKLHILGGVGDACAYTYLSCWKYKHLTYFICFSSNWEKAFPLLCNL